MLCFLTQGLNVNLRLLQTGPYPAPLLGERLGIIGVVGAAEHRLLQQHPYSCLCYLVPKQNQSHPGYGCPFGITGKLCGTGIKTGTAIILPITITIKPSDFCSCSSSSSSCSSPSLSPSLALSPSLSPSLSLPLCCS